MDSFVLDGRNIFELSDEQFYQLCRRHPEIHFERSASGELIIIPPTGSVSGNRNFSLTTQLGRWVDRHPELGVGFDSSTCFKLPNGAVEVLTSPMEVDCSAVLPGFVLKLISILLG